MPVPPLRGFPSPPGELGASCRVLGQAPPHSAPCGCVSHNVLPTDCPQLPERGGLWSKQRRWVGGEPPAFCFPSSSGGAKHWLRGSLPFSPSHLCLSICLSIHPSIHPANSPREGPDAIGEAGAQFRCPKRLRHTRGQRGLWYSQLPHHVSPGPALGDCPSRKDPVNAPAQPAAARGRSQGPERTVACPRSHSSSVLS